MLVQISSLIIDRANRQRRELANIPELAESIRINGQIQPIVITRDNKLIAGERRIEACKLLGMTEIKAIYVDAADDLQLELIELAENVDRVELAWKDRVTATARYVRLRQKQEALSNTALATELNIPERTLAYNMMIAEELERGNDYVINASDYSVARNAAERAIQRRKADELNNVQFAPAKLLALKEDRLEAALAAPVFIPDQTDAVPVALQENTLPFSFVNNAFGEWASTYTGPKFNFLHCDFPYGIKADRHAQGAIDLFPTYADDPDVYWNLLVELSSNMDKIVAPSAHMIFWFSMKYYEATRAALVKMGWTVNRFPLIWHKSDNSGILPDPNRGPRQVYETAFLCARGDRKIIAPTSNHISGPTSKTTHMSEKNLTMLEGFMKMFVDKHTFMLDPTAGSGNALVAAHRLGASHIIGVEVDPEIYANSLSHMIGLVRGPVL